MIVSGVRFVAGRNDYADRDGTKYGIAIHNTSNTASASAEASYATRRTDGISSHLYGDGREVIQSIDTKYRAGHAGSYEGNEHAVAVEITGTNDRSRAWWIANVAWDKLGAALAQVCRAYDIEPRRASVAEMQRNPKVRAFYSHNDMRQAWGGTTHTDPGPNFPWDYLFAAVTAHLSPATPVQEDDMTPEQAKTLTQARDAGVEAVRLLVGIRGAVNALPEAIDALDEDADPAAVADLIVAKLPAGIAKQVADELAARLTS